MATGKAIAAGNDWVVLGALVQEHDGMTPGDLVRRTGLPERTVRVSVGRLIERGHADREGKRLVWATAAGWDAHGRLAASRVIPRPQPPRPRPQPRAPTAAPAVMPNATPRVTARDPDPRPGPTGGLLGAILAPLRALTPTAPAAAPLVTAPRTRRPRNLQRRCSRCYELRSVPAPQTPQRVVFCPVCNGPLDPA
jgi:hypothetical protein